MQHHTSNVAHLGISQRLSCNHGNFVFKEWGYILSDLCTRRYALSVILLVPWHISPLGQRGYAPHSRQETSQDETYLTFPVCSGPPGGVAGDLGRPESSSTSSPRFLVRTLRSSACETRPNIDASATEPHTDTRSAPAQNTVGTLHWSAPAQRGSVWGKLSHPGRRTELAGDVTTLQGVRS